MIAASLALTGCSDTSRSGTATCDLPDAVDPSTLSLEPSLFVPKLEHDLILEHPTAEARAQLDRTITTMILDEHDSDLAALLANVGSIDAGTYSLYEFHTSEELHVRACPLLEELQRLSDPVRVLIVDVANGAAETT